MGNVKLLILLFSITLSSCAKFGYLYEQGVGQLGLIAKAKSNEKMLKDPEVPDSVKEKIRKIEVYKKHFYKYWDRHETKIYSKTTMLDSKAVTYLVISSPFNKIKAHKECFPIMGCFPYIGFFKRDSAKEYALEMQQKDFVTYTRPVYAYSTLGYFTDTILSSFFYYKDFELAELIFHELFHTIFFVKDEVQLNENLANYFGKEMAREYFNLSEEQKRELDEKKRIRELLSLGVVKLSAELNKTYLQSKTEDKSKALEVLNKFLENRFNPYFKELCKKESIADKSCFPLNRNWNNASLAAFLTYEKKADQLSKLQKSRGFNIKQLFGFIEKRYEEFKKQRDEKDFSKFLFSTMI